jgi:hypothetical protein
MGTNSRRDFKPLTLPALSPTQLEALHVGQAVLELAASWGSVLILQEEDAESERPVGCRLTLLGEFPSRDLMPAVVRAAAPRVKQGGRRPSRRPGRHQCLVTVGERTARVTVSGRRLVEVVLTAAGRPPKKPCKNCKRAKFWYEFSLSQQSDDGVNSYCLQCEREKQRAYQERCRRLMRDAA